MATQILTYFSYLIISLSVRQDWTENLQQITHTVR